MQKGRFWQRAFEGKGGYCSGRVKPLQGVAMGIGQWYCWSERGHMVFDCFFVCPIRFYLLPSDIGSSSYIGKPKCGSSSYIEKRKCYTERFTKDIYKLAWRVM